MLNRPGAMCVTAVIGQSRASVATVQPSSGPSWNAAIQITYTISILIIDNNF